MLCRRVQELATAVGLCLADACVLFCTVLELALAVGLSLTKAAAHMAAADDKATATEMAVKMSNKMQATEARSQKRVYEDAANMDLLLLDAGDEELL